MLFSLSTLAACELPPPPGWGTAELGACHHILFVIWLRMCHAVILQHPKRALALLGEHHSLPLGPVGCSGSSSLPTLTGSASVPHCGTSAFHAKRNDTFGLQSCNNFESLSQCWSCPFPLSTTTTLTTCSGFSAPGCFWALLHMSLIQHFGQIEPNSDLFFFLLSAGATGNEK